MYLGHEGKLTKSKDEAAPKSALPLNQPGGRSLFLERHHSDSAGHGLHVAASPASVRCD